MTTQVVHDILDELLDAVVHYSEWDIATKARFLKGTAANGCLLMNTAVSGPRFDLFSVIRTAAPARVLTNYCLRSGTEVLQLKCVDQKASGYCGHYALYFALCGLELCRSTTEERIVGYLEELARAGSFWRRYWLSVEELRANVRRMGSDSWWPWTLDCIAMGDMERSYMRYLLLEDHHSRYLDGASLISVLHYAYGQFNNSAASVRELQDKIDAFRSATQPVCMALVLGVTNHWLTVLAYRIPEINRVGVLYMDSNNTPILKVSDDELNTILHLKEQERMKKKGQGYSPWQRTIRLQAWKDQRRLLDVLCECLSGKHDLRTELLDASWDSLLTSYYNSVCTHGAELGHQTICLLLLVQWLQTERHPKGIREMQVSSLHSLGACWLTSTLRDRIIRWMVDVRCICQDTSGIEETSDLLKVLGDLDQVVAVRDDQRHPPLMN